MGDPTAGMATVLVADASDALAERLRRILPGVEMLHGADVREVQRLAARRQPSLVIVNEHADLPALILCTRLRTDPRYGNPVLFAITDAEPGAALAGLTDECVARAELDLDVLAPRIAASLRRAVEHRDASPLTGLPGNSTITEELQRRVTADEDVALLYVDLDNFKALNDHYGFLRGDEVIVAVAGILRSLLGEGDRLFIGHVGGDDFVVLAPTAAAEGVAKDVLDRFEAIAESFYDPADLRRGGIVSEDRTGAKRKVPVVSLSVGIAATSTARRLDYRELVALATEMKGVAKGNPGNSFAVDRRDGGTPPPPRRRAGMMMSRARSRREARGAGGGRRRALVPTALVSLLLAASISAPAMASSANPGDVLWPVKLQIERVRLTLATDEERELELLVEFGNRRLAELMTLNIRQVDDQLIGRAVVELARTTNELHAQMILSDASPGAVTLLSAARQAEVALAQQSEILATLIAAGCDGKPADTCEELVAALDGTVRALAEVRRDDDVAETSAAPPQRAQAESQAADQPDTVAGARPFGSDAPTQAPTGAGDSGAAAPAGDPAAAEVPAVTEAPPAPTAPSTPGSGPTQDPAPPRQPAAPTPGPQPAVRPVAPSPLPIGPPSAPALPLEPIATPPSSPLPLDPTPISTDPPAIPTDPPATPSEPAPAPSATPSEAPSEAPSETPSETPSEAPSETPSETPSEAPSETPSEPTEAPSEVPSEPTEAPSEVPSEPTEAPTDPNAAPSEPAPAPELPDPTLPDPAGPGLEPVPDGTPPAIDDPIADLTPRTPPTDPVPDGGAPPPEPDPSDPPPPPAPAPEPAPPASAAPLALALAGLSPTRQSRRKNPAGNVLGTQRG